MTNYRPLTRFVALATIFLLSLACSRPAATPTAPPLKETLIALTTPYPTSSPEGEAGASGLSASEVAGLSEAEITTLGSLAQVDDYPLYTMRYQGAYASAALYAPERRSPAIALRDASPRPAWACSLFAALADADQALYGRNFDWRFSPALLLFTDPPDGYASVTMVDLEYLGFGEEMVRALTELPLNERRALLETPHWPFDGMNEHGLVVGMAAVADSPLPDDPGKPEIGSLGIMREMLDHARNVDEALEIIAGYNVRWAGGPPLHYLLADPSGRAALVEYYQGKRVVLPNSDSWHQATNFLLGAAGESAAGQCWRYDRIHERLNGSQGRLTEQEAMGLLEEVSQEGTQWSIVYGMADGAVSVAVGQDYQNVHTFFLTAAGK
jgi:hypothetical protein